MPRKAYSIPHELLRHALRLPRSRDQDALAQLVEHQISQRTWGRITGTTQPAASAELRRIRRRLEIVRRHRQLQIRATAKTQTIRELNEGSLFSRREARFLWELYWTTSPTETNRRMSLPGWRGVLARVLATRPNRLGPNARALRAGLAFLQRTRHWGVLWGKKAGSQTPSKPGKHGNRFVEDVGEIWPG